MCAQRPLIENSQKEECDDHPGKKVDAKGIREHREVGRICLTDTRARDQDGSEREPECAVGREGCQAINY